jgi:DNA mismatch repair protein MutL
VQASPVGTIRILPAPVVARIAAGEVITRPRAAVKELIDNALDAGATRIDVEIVGGGYQEIAIHDDGHGIATADAGLVLIRHATSKLPPDDDLHVINTLGFRGEALASIASVAEVEIRSRYADERIGQLLHARYGEIEHTPLVRQRGTSVVVRDLFNTLPVRRISADPVAEARAIRALVSQFALIRPDVSITLTVDGRRVFATTGGSLREAFAELNGVESLAYLLDVGPLEAGEWSITGVISAPTATSGGAGSGHRSRRDGIVLSVNGRLCGSPEIQRAIERAYAAVLPRHRYPRVVLAITVPPSRVDVNVHPAKEHVVLLDGPEIAEALEGEIRSRLGRTAHMVTERHSLALQLGEMPGLRAAEAGVPYGSFDWGDRVVAAGSLPQLRVVGQIEDTLIVCESDLGTLLIDQHRAHERVIYERLITHASSSVQEPTVIALPTSQLMLLDRNAADLRDSGWDWQELGPDRLLIRACPVDLTPDDLLHVIDRVSAESTHSVLAATACHAAIRKRRPLSPDAAVELLEALTTTPTPTTCPHGQPIVLNLDHAFLERQFGWR